MDSFNLAVEQFHWLRPLWLLGLLPALAMALLLWRQSQSARNWGSLIAPELLGYLLDGESNRSRRWLVWALFAAWVITCLAMAGPSWEKRPMPVHKNQNALVIALDLSPSMNAEDLNPARLVRARLKIIDILRERGDGFTGLVAYAGDAHAVAPLTDDTGTIINLLPALHPQMMPLPGSNTEAAIAQALELLEDGGAASGSILLVTDGVVDQAVASIEQQLEGRSLRLSVLGVGSSEGAPVPNPRGGFERDRDGNIVVARLPEDRLSALAQTNGGRYHRLTGDSEDIGWLLGQESIGEESQKQLEREFDTWYDRGHWLALLLLPIVLYAFRPGLLVVVLALPLLSLTPQTSHAQDWRAPWLNPDQRGQRLLDENQPAEAAENFENPEWRGSALYKAGEYQAAAEAFAQQDTARADYNRGNALARAGELKQALEAYDEALEKDPNLEDAQANKKLIEDLLEQQEQQDGDQQQDDQEGEGEQQEQQEQQGDQSQNQQEDSQSGDQDSQSESQQQPGEDSEPQDSSEQQPQDETPPDQDSQEEQSAEQDAQEQNQDEAEAQQQEEQQEQEQAEQDAGAPEEADGQDQDSQETMAGMQEDDLTDEERQAMEQWLRRVPDDPSGLLRRKFMYESQLQQRERYRREAPSSTEQQRW